MPRSPLRLAIPSLSAAWPRSGKGVPALVLCAALSVLTACGQKGPLYLPRDPAPKATPPAADPVATPDATDAPAVNEAEAESTTEPKPGALHAA